MAVRALANELKELKKHPVEGVVVDVPDECNLFRWEVRVAGRVGRAGGVSPSVPGAPTRPLR